MRTSAEAIVVGKQGAPDVIASFDFFRQHESKARPALHSLTPIAFSRNARFSSTASSVVDLDHSEHIPSDGNRTRGALVILHGLFGSKQNWSSLSKAFSKDLNKPVYALDLRNHGRSPHALPMTYTQMATDVLHFIQKKELEGISLLGHSMGGKVVMSLALNPSLPPSTLSNLIVADIAPNRGKLSEEFMNYIEAMKKIERLRLRTRKEATQVLQEYEKDASVVAFLLTNIIIPSDSSEHVHFRIPLDILGDAISEMGSFPYAPGETKFEGRTLFIKGEKSKFINRHNIPTIEAFFPNMKMQTLDAGHWVHGEKPNEFKKLVEDFIREES
ncbi:alpha/beta-hydrolase [Dendrothele bispora CBS 962.96]|uniref:Alpha/beta-hydrolase n=1 Tax=Dendrothele bispora (strain CBS 962.96) TaxID=1314807 RepID=A0A4S8MPJ5_DENBC|nr:alpha/beta-hydrolase [Dendrothele bispora CBS 962.96]